MSVYLYEGLPGSGKSYHVLKDTILGALKEGRRVFHNLPVRRDVIEANEFTIGYLKKRLISINQDFLINLPKYVPVLRNSLLVIDEAHETFFSGDKIKDDHLRNFWTYHRHYGVDVVVCTQNSTNLNKIIRGVIAIRFEFRNLGFMGFKGLYRVKQFEGVDGKLALGSKKGKFVKKYFDYYKSVDFGSSNLFKIQAPSSFSIYRNIAFLILVLFGGGYLITSLSIFDGYGFWGNEKKAQFVDEPYKGDPKDLLKKQKRIIPVSEPKRRTTKVNLGSASFYESDLDSTVSTESIYGDKVPRGIYQVNGAIGVGNEFMYVIKGKTRTYWVRSFKDLIVGSKVRVY